MTSRSVRSPDGRRPMDDFDDVGGGFAGFLMRRRAAVGGVTAFAVAFAYVGANAMWYQPHAHGGPLFATRPLVAPLPKSLPESLSETMGGPMPARLDQAQQKIDQAAVETIIRIEREKLMAQQERTGSIPVTEAQPAAAGNPVVEEVQRILASLNLYTGDIDGLTGPQTRSAIEAYRKMVGLTVSGEIDDQLLTQLGTNSPRGNGRAPLPQEAPGTDMIETASSAARGDAMVMRIQAGLKAFGNDGIEIDGVVGSRTKAAILEFQSLFGLPQTGEPDQVLYAKMRDIGLTD